MMMDRWVERQVMMVGEAGVCREGDPSLTDHYMYKSQSERGPGPLPTPCASFEFEFIIQRTCVNRISHTSRTASVINRTNEAKH